MSESFLAEFFTEFFLFQYADDAVVSGGATMGYICALSALETGSPMPHHSHWNCACKFVARGGFPGARSRCAYEYVACGT